MEPFVAELTLEQIEGESEKMMTDGKERISEIRHALSAYLPPAEKDSYLLLIDSLVNHSLLLGRVQQTMDNVKTLKSISHAYDEKKETEIFKKATALTHNASSFLCGYAEEQEFLRSTI